jgi:hypothetical protein
VEGNIVTYLLETMHHGVFRNAQLNSAEISSEPSEHLSFLMTVLVTNKLQENNCSEEKRDQVLKRNEIIENSTKFLLLNFQENVLFPLENLFVELMVIFF